MNTKLKNFLIVFFRDFILLSLIASIIGIIAFLIFDDLTWQFDYGTQWLLVGLAEGIVCALLAFGWTFLFTLKNKYPQGGIIFFECMIAWSVLQFTILFIISDGYPEAREMLSANIPQAPFLPLIVFNTLLQNYLATSITGIMTYASVTVTALFRNKKLEAKEVSNFNEYVEKDSTAIPNRPAHVNISKQSKITLCALAALTIVCSGISVAMYKNSPQTKYTGHGFDYMHGYSSTDFSDYYPYSDPSKLVLPENVPFTIKNEKDMPILDGAEACYPLYSGLGKAFYENIAEIEKEASESDYTYQNGKIITFTNTVHAFNRMIENRVDMLFGARLSAYQLEQAGREGIEVVQTPIGREAFIFFVEEDNPVDNLTSEQIRKIYSGEIKNWNEVGGKNQKITAFQRPANSGSQTMMEYFMGDVPLKKPMSYETVNAMGGVVSHVAQYANEDGAMGYTFRYFLIGLNQEKHVKILSVDGVFPDPENITNGTYPAIAGLYCITRADEDNPYVQKMLDYLLSEDGQNYIEKTGYSKLK